MRLQRRTGQERHAGALDGDLLSLFIEVRPWAR